MNVNDLQAGQVWELLNDSVMTPAVLLRLDERAGGEWDCLSLYDGTIFSASLSRWRSRRMHGLVGERIA